ncbi:hypothetical protein GGH95_004130, partial [Coemansia sp. RSA 1836]
MDGSLDIVKAEAKEFVAELLGNLTRRRLTDRICQLYARAVLMPMLTYRLMGLPLLVTEVEDIAQPIYTWVKHGFGLPSTSPGTTVHHKYGAHIPRLSTMLTARNAEMTIRFRNGTGSQAFTGISRRLDIETRRRLKFIGDPLAHGRFISSSMAREIQGVGRPWLAVLGRTLASFGMAVAIPAMLGYRPFQLLEVLRRAPEETLLTSLYEKGITRVDQVFGCRPMGAIYVAEGGAIPPGSDQAARATGADAVWRRLIRKELENVQQLRTAVDKSWINIPLVRQALHLREQRDPRKMFTPTNIRAQLAQQAAGLDWAQAAKVVAYTDGSLEERVGRQTMGMGVYIMLLDAEEEIVAEGDFYGRCQEGPFSSTMAELMAMVMALSLVPAHIPLMIRSDSRAAIGALKGVQRQDPRRQWRKSSMALLLEWTSEWFGEHWPNLRLRWVKGHSGDEGNAMADELAARGHEDFECSWSLKLGPPPKMLWWICHNRQPTMKKPSKMMAHLEREWMADRLLEQVRTAHPEQ